MKLDANAAGNFWGDFPKFHSASVEVFQNYSDLSLSNFQNSLVSSFLKFSSRQNIIGVFIWAFFSQTFKLQIAGYKRFFDVIWVKLGHQHVTNMKPEGSNIKEWQGLVFEVPAVRLFGVEKPNKNI